ncbi:putative transcription regulator PAB1642 [Aspergillus neoniger CBS 115656]|uniref:Transcription regulator PAB1642 n=1 Tax=Aspergillus neoniger (strain CBS 115656) TaxID=1448310 RepID=A0A318ZAL4_ASPNB|nr:transcription regulator PAB1642 [Aspergillus neoniger CBS 115656]PYH33502.1 transcription regulator PAB1642 [Aspergillus neoniger CBS 115656]
MTSLTAHFLNLNPSALHTSTTHPFLHSAGTSTLPKATLSAWLSQDRLYAQSYVRFIGLLLSKIRLPYTTTATTKTPAPLESRILSLLTSALLNIQRELTFFETVAAEYNLDLQVPPPGATTFGPSEATHAYTDLFLSSGSSGVTLLEGLVVLWATEVCYYKAWGYARGVMEKENKGREGSNDADGGALRVQFIPNWTSEEFGRFVDEIAGLVDEVAAGVAGSEREELLRRCERWWRQVVWLEGMFWPEV